ncbi:MAG: hypothetical protein PHU64_06140 [Candidatus Omnitrophica bacterium]|nr:hypothetical protein [Candidatus Omnitrophota bacterium]MDD5429514.1 hypothetical protein [Candidatus Omnitrophota bacterium]
MAYFKVCLEAECVAKLALKIKKKVFSRHLSRLLFLDKLRKKNFNMEGEAHVEENQEETSRGGFS